MSERMTAIAVVQQIARKVTAEREACIWIAETAVEKHAEWAEAFRENGAVATAYKHDLLAQGARDVLDLLRARDEADDE